MPAGAIGKTDAEKRLNGTYRPGTSVAARERRLSEKIFAGPGFQDVPDPKYNLNDWGQREYFRLCGKLLAQGRLSESTLAISENFAILSEELHARRSTGQRVPAVLLANMDRYLALLKLVEDTTPIGGNVALQPKENPFDVCGVTLAPFAQGRPRGSAAA